ncbi:hypothetical protein MtrunA17_Chr4g0029481 [Medicago truncatula]|uniref:Transmembrane protein n=1 Tax=Medicago truncatula TaxID=3880 RepID=A0A072UKW1_MEDTR|nr:hypothetical protein MTR_4g059833 [Medicago truncatula]RHN60773.1 hypothetical protein MtrunA17_Chr4g0029481 [Medicago truncatula]
MFAVLVWFCFVFSSSCCGVRLLQIVKSISIKCRSNQCLFLRYGFRLASIKYIFITNSEIWLFQTTEYSHICRLMYFTILGYEHECYEFVRKFIIFVFSEFVLYRRTLTI